MMFLKRKKTKEDKQKSRVEQKNEPNYPQENTPDIASAFRDNLTEEEQKAKIEEFLAKRSVLLTSMVHSAPQTKAESRITTSEINFFVPRPDLDAELFCCVFHHPLRSAIITPYNQPIDRLHIVSNERIFEGETIFADGRSQITVRLMEAKANENQVTMDKKICHRLPIYDAYESWDFIFSHRQIRPEEYLNEYKLSFDGSFYRFA